MGWFGKNKETAVNAEEDEQKSREAILNNAKFVESLDTHPTIDTDSDFETLKQAHDSFKVKESTSKELKNLFKNEIKRDLGINLDFDDTNKVSEEIDKFLEQELIDNPERITELKEEISQFNEFQKQIDQQKKIMEKLGASMEALTGKQEAIEKVKDTKKWFQKFRSYSENHIDARNEAEKGYGINLDQLKAEYANVMEKIQTGQGTKEQLDDLQEKFTDLRKSILQDLAPIAALHELAQNKAKEKLEAMMDPTDPKNDTVKNLEAARALFDKMVGDDFQQETGVDYKAADIDIDDIYESLNQRLEEAFKGDVDEAIDKVKDRSLTFKKMKEGLAPMFKKTDLGDKSAPEVRQFLLDYLNDELMPTLPKSKQILLTAAIESFA